MAQPVLGGDEHAPPTSFTTRRPPVVFDDSIIIAATHPNLQGNPVIDGSFLSDFYAFNYLLKGLGSEQTWLTAADPHKLLAKREHYLHGNPFQDRKIVLDRDLLERGELTPVTVIQSSEMIDRFLQEVRTGSKKAKSQAAPLLLLVFCHGGEHEFFLNSGNGEKGLTLTRLKEAIEPGCRVTLVSTAYESGGWVVRDSSDPSFQPMDMTLLSASKEESNSWQRSLSVGRYCGSVFASSLIDTLTSTASPLLQHVDGAATNNDTANKEPSDLQPRNPNQQQTLTYNAFCQSILDTCRDKVHRLWREQGFTFSAQGDEWEHSWTGRSGIPLTHFEQRWNALAVYPYTGSLKRKLDMDPDPSNPSFQYKGSTRTGGKELIDELGEAIHQNRVVDMARLFLQTCPGDENRGWYHLTNGVLENAARGLPDDEELVPWITADMIRFRWEMSLLCDHIVSFFGLRAPNGLICLLWDDRAWYYHNESTPRSQLAMYDDIRSYLLRRRFPHSGGNSHGPPFVRVVGYLAAALVETTQTFDECMAKADEILAFVKALKGNFHEHVVQNGNVVESGQKWFKTIGK
ncbi:hypothetical protein CFAM422_011135 [Trichoderma lentiforme]|uniref:Uncharacterized protein n=1 Tax=Trichoderma lentiforme TaxID=1567552 RepID=A0A9P4X4U3_9HYPO|nr:hypothetical protein CFAM422_011135 [Trichoderma lentiforme]